VVESLLPVLIILFLSRKRDNEWQIQVDNVEISIARRPSHRLAMLCRFRKKKSAFFAEKDPERLAGTLLFVCLPLKFKSF